MKKLNINVNSPVRNTKIDLLESRWTKRATLELTTDCNLSCIYCARIQPSYKTAALNPANLGNIIRSLVRRKVVNLNINGHGETTMIRNWHLYINKLLEKDFLIGINTNLARALSEDEVNTFSRFDHISVSCDTMDEKLFARLRRGASLPVVLDNICRIKECALKRKRRLPRLIFNCVVCDKNVYSVHNFVLSGMAMGIKNFVFCNLVKYPDVDGIEKVQPITALPLKELFNILALFLKTFDTITKHGGSYYCIGGLLDGVKEKIIGEKSNEAKERYNKMTRDCIDPWSNAIIHADYTIAHCCIVPESLGVLGKGETLDGILSSPKIKEYREGILSGRLNESCLKCRIRPWIRVGNLRRKVMRYLSSFSSEC